MEPVYSYSTGVKALEGLPHTSDTLRGHIETADSISSPYIWRQSDNAKPDVPPSTDFVKRAVETLLPNSQRYTLCAKSIHSYTWLCVLLQREVHYFKLSKSKGESNLCRCSHMF